jgi:AraC-like DNA-binding protein
MLEVETFDSNINNEWLVRQFENYSFDGSQVIDKFIPRPYISVVFHFKECPHFVDEISFILDPVFLAPIIPKAISLKFQGDMDTLVVNCKATVFSRLFILDLSPVPKRIIDLPYQIFLPLWKKMAGFKNFNERIECFTEFINSIQPTTYVPDVVDVFYDKIVEKSITVPLKEIMRECYASKSTLIRKFVKRTGVSPKTLARIVRLNYAWGKIVNENAVDYQDLVFYGNYFDQSHFINDFKAIIGETPGHFFRRNLDIVKIFSGKSTK